MIECVAEAMGRKQQAPIAVWSVVLLPAREVTALRLTLRAVAPSISRWALGHSPFKLVNKPPAHFYPPPLSISSFLPHHSPPMPSDSLIHASSGALGGICAMAITYPLISISTRAQVEAKRHPGESSVEAAMHLIKREGVRSLYDGLGSSLIGIAVTNGIYYLFFEESRALLLLRPPSAARRSLTTLESMLAGAVAGTMTAVLTNPIWVVNTRQTVRVVRPAPGLPPTARSKRMGFLQTVLHILRTDGAMALFRGLGPALILVINPILQYTLFEQMKNILIARRKSAFKLKQSSPSSTATQPKHVLKDADYFILGAISKLFATGSTYPYLTVKSRMQSGQAEGREYKDTLDGLRKIVKKDGLRGLYRGIAPKLTQSVLTAAFLFLAKERIYLATKKALKTASKIAPIKS